MEGLEESLLKTRTGGYIVDEILQVRGRGQNKEYYIQWGGFGKGKSTWVSESSLKHEKTGEWTCPNAMKAFLSKKKTRKK